MAGDLSTLPSVDSSIIGEVHLEIVDENGSLIEQVQVGEEITLNVYVKDLRQEKASGFVSVGMDIVYRDQLLDFIGVDKLAKTSYLPLGFDYSVGGLLDEIGTLARNFLSPGLGDQLVASYKFTATEAGIARFGVDDADGVHSRAETTTIGFNETVNHRMQFRGTQIEILAADGSRVPDDFWIPAENKTGVPAEPIVVDEIDQPPSMADPLFVSNPPLPYHPASSEAGASHQRPVPIRFLSKGWEAINDRAFGHLAYANYSSQHLRSVVASNIHNSSSLIDSTVYSTRSNVLEVSSTDRAPTERPAAVAIVSNPEIFEWTGQIELSPTSISTITTAMFSEDYVTKSFVGTAPVIGGMVTFEATNLLYRRFDNRVSDSPKRTVGKAKAPERVLDLAAHEIAFLNWGQFP